MGGLTDSCRGVPSPYAARLTSQASEQLHFSHADRATERDGGQRATCARLQISLDEGTRKTLDKVSVAALDSDQFAKDNLTRTKPRILCIICTRDANRDLTAAVIETWGRRCSGFVAFSDVHDPAIPTVHVPLQSDDQYENLWFKVAAAWKYVYAHYVDQFDWFLMADDDTYVVVDNLEVRAPVLVSSFIGNCSFIFVLFGVFLRLMAY